VDPIDTIADPPIILGASLATAAVQLARRDVEGAVRFAVAAPLACGIAKLLKYAVDEHRPRLVGKQLEQSFPSGHSAAISAYAVSIVLATRRWWTLPLAAAAIGVVNVSRVWRREHWAKDVIAGDVIGLVGAAVAAGAVYALHHHRAKTVTPTRSEPMVGATTGSPSRF